MIQSVIHTLTKSTSITSTAPAAHTTIAACTVLLLSHFKNSNNYCYYTIALTN